MRKYSIHTAPLVRSMDSVGSGMASSPVRIVYWSLVLRTGLTTSTLQSYDVCRNASPSASPTSSNERKYLHLYGLSNLFHRPRSKCAYAHTDAQGHRTHRGFLPTQTRRGDRRTVWVRPERALPQCRDAPHARVHPRGGRRPRDALAEPRRGASRGPHCEDAR